MGRVISLIMVLIITSSTLTGCFDSQEVTEWAYVYSIGVEKGVKDKLRLTLQVPSMKGTPSGQIGNDSGNISANERDGILTITLDCPTFYSGIDMVNTFLSRQLNYMHVKYIVFSEKLSRESIEKYLIGLVRGRQVRREMYVIVSKCSVREFLLGNLPSMGTSLTRKEENQMKMAEKNGLFCKVTYGDLLNASKSYYSQGIAPLANINISKEFDEYEGASNESTKSNGAYYPGKISRIGGSTAEFIGTAVFNGGKMVGELNGDETRVMLMARGEYSQGSFVVNDPKQPDTIITLDIRKQKRPSVKVNVKDDKPVVNLKIFLEGDIAAIQSTENYESKELKPLLEKAMTESIKKNLDKTIKKCKDLDCDVFKFGNVAAMHFGTIEKFEEYNWLKKFKDAKINTEVEFTIRRTGTMLKSSKITSTEKDDEQKQKKGTNK